MRQYDLVILGLAKSGTTSIFEMLSSHPEICPTKVKEAMKRLRVEPFKTYFKKYFIDINKDTKILLDGTPGIFVYPEKIKSLEEILKQNWVGKLKIIYIIRNPINRIFSQLITLERAIKRYPPDGIIWFRKWFNDDQTVKEEALEFICTTHLDSKCLEQAQFFTNNIYITKLNKLDTHSILNFLDIKNVELKLEHLNKTVQTPHNEKLIENIHSFVDKNKEYLKQLFTDDIKKIQLKFGLDLTDIIKEMEKR